MSIATSGEAGAQEDEGLVDLVVGDVGRGAEAEDVAAGVGEEAVLAELRG